VREGYARNYLIPQRVAVFATPDAIKRFEKQRKKLEAEREKIFSRSRSLGDKLAKVGLVFERPVGQGGRLFGSVTPLDIVSELAKQEITVEKRSVLLNGPIKTLGDHTVRIRLHSQVVIDVPLKVKALEVKKGSSEGDVEATESAETSEQA
jgi:large subunit ribosomal protein L9